LRREWKSKGVMDGESSESTETDVMVGAGKGKSEIVWDDVDGEK